ncbi:MAG: 16S rRNA (cytosine(1402)-N(4))-methyltransferase RsmH [Gammaproteobacteria bacterium]|nr:16S rRNA (cytosine(1402)-N(4))-methyltransferase RsmH [Gammaproteobacteria bacterium]
MEENINNHQPVLLNTALEQLAIQPNGIYIDATFGRGGHSSAILSQLNSEGQLFAIDQDPEAVAFAQQQFSHDSRFHIHHGSFAALKKIAMQYNLIGRVNGILFDLGVSSPQLDNPERGFSFLREGPLDMRMNSAEGVDAATWIAEVDEQTLSSVLWRYGEERFARRIARAIVQAREENPIRTTKELAEIVARAIPKWQQGKHPATRSFQAIRMAVNQELESLEQALQQSIELLALQGRLVVISFHSLEDRIVKHFMREQEQGESLPRHLPIKHVDIEKSFKCVGRAIRPDALELSDNPRARSATLRVGEKLR